MDAVYIHASALRPADASERAGRYEKPLTSGLTLFDGIAARFDDGSMRFASCGRLVDLLVVALAVLMRRNDADTITRPKW